MGRAIGPTNEPLQQVLAVYPAVFHSATVVPLGNHGGFSGARLWRLDTVAGAFCLRAGAATESRSHLQQRHALMLRARSAGLTFVPAVISTLNGSMVVEHCQRCWEMMEWMPGTADFHAAPTPARLRAAVTALAQLHGTWQGPATVGVPPAIARRMEAARRVITAPVSMPRHPLLEPFRVRTRQVVGRWLPEVLRLLNEWGDFRCSLQPCLRDVWHDHLLYEGDRLTGLIDYAGIGMDNVAADLARMLGSLIGDNDDRWRQALVVYRAHRPLSQEEERLARALDRAGVIGCLCNWLRWLDQQESILSNSPAVRRLEELLTRVEKW